MNDGVKLQSMHDDMFELIMINQELIAVLWEMTNRIAPDADEIPPNRWRPTLSHAGMRIEDLLHKYPKL